VDRSGVPFDFDTVVIDELSSFKNYRSIRFRSLNKVRMRISRIVGLTGTPASNGLMDLWAEFRILDYGKRLGRFITHYREAYFRPDKTNGQVVFSYKPLPGAEDAIYRQISDIAISMRAADHIKMPELVSNTYRVGLSEKERKVYESLKDEMAIDIGKDEITASNAAALSNKLLQLANGAIYTDEKGVREVHQRKLDALEDLVEAANGKPLLVAYWFKHDLSRIEGRLREKGIAYEKLDSASSISRWNEGKTAVGLIHPASAGHGLNLQSGGSTIVWFGLTWSLELYQQTIARLYRQGQRDKTVVVIHIIASGTIDEYVMKALSKKEKVQDSLIEAVKAEIGGRKQ
jgi:SNF2 family DNA or RNA helicase